MPTIFHELVFTPRKRFKKTKPKAPLPPGVRNLTFDDLPLEVRDKIYDLTTERTSILITNKNSLDSLPLNVFRLNSQIRAEALSRVYGTTKLTFVVEPACNGAASRAWLHAARDDTVAALQKIVVLKEHQNGRGCMLYRAQFNIDLTRKASHDEPATYNVSAGMELLHECHMMCHSVRNHLNSLICSLEIEDGRRSMTKALLAEIFRVVVDA